MRYFVTIGAGENAFERVIRFEDTASGLVAFVQDDEDAEPRTVPVDACELERGKAIHLLVEGACHEFYLDPTDGGYEVHYRGECLQVDVVDERERLARQVHGSTKQGPRDVRASMPGVVVSVDVEVGGAVEVGQTLLVIEAMKMQNPITAEGPGSVTAIHVEQGQAVAAGDRLLTLG